MTWISFKKRLNADGTRWRTSSFLFISLLLCGGLIFYTDIFQLKSFEMPFVWPKARFIRQSEINDMNGFLIKTEGCRIPFMDPFDKAVKKYYEKEKRVVCNGNKPPLMESNLTSIYLLNTSLVSYEVKNISALNCCYSNFHRVKPAFDENDNKYEFHKCVPFKNIVKINTDFIRVICKYNDAKIYKDFFSFVPVRSKFNNISTNTDSKKLNVLVVGLDAVSRVNLHRQMPKTIEMLKQLGAVEFLGYNKVADNTFPNLVPVLTGLSEEELVKKCWHKKNDRFDKCKFIWNSYGNNGFATAFGEDATDLGMFNHLKQGFKNQPTDYYWGSFNGAAQDQIGNQRKMNVFECIGSREAYQILLNYIMNLAETMNQNRIPYFGFFWSSSLSHDYLNKPQLGDDYYAEFFNKLFFSDVSENTVLVFLSDHGMRWGDIRSTYQGRMEERLPFLFILLPKTYQEDYYQQLLNLKKNVRKLTTPFDLHETLKDILNPLLLSQEAMNDRIARRKGNERGISLFEPIPDNRTCDSAGISSHYCTCQISVAVSVNDTVLIAAAHHAVEQINFLINDFAECASLALAEIYSANVRSAHILLKVNSFATDYMVVFRTVPGDGKFEATVRNTISKETDRSDFKVVGVISRINVYRNQSNCISDLHLKLYCYCVI